MPALGLDLDGTITDAPDFFKQLVEGWGGPVYVITYRDDMASCVRDLERYGIEVTEIILVNSLPEKAEWINKLGITVFFDDMDEVTKYIPYTVKVFKPRNSGNYCYDTKRWLYTEDTGYEIPSYR
jgi:hypothetical protein